MAKLRVDKIASVGVSTETTGSVFFDGGADYLSLASSDDFAYGTGDFTWEMWVYVNSFSSNRYLLDHGSNGGTISNGGSNNTTLKYYNTTVGTGSALHSTGFGTLSTSTWYHLAAARKNGTTSLYTNGTLTASASDSHNYGAQVLTIGRYGSGGNAFSGYMSNLRICKGHAVYTSNFTPPTRELEVHQGPDDDRTVLLCCYDGENIFADKSGRHTIAAYGDRLSSPTPTVTNSPIGITTFQPGLTRDVDNTFGPTFQGGAGFTSQNWLTLPKGTTTDRNRTGGRGLVGGGESPTVINSIQYLTISTTGNSQDFGDLTAGRTRLGASGSSTRGIFAGGATPSRSDIIDFVTIAETGNAVDFGNLLNARDELGGAGNDTRALFFTGSAPGSTNVIEFVTTATLGNAQDFGDLTRDEREGCGCGSPTRGIFFIKDNTINYVTWATTGDAQDFGDTGFGNNGDNMATSDTTRAIIAGGTQGPTSASNGIHYLTISTLGNTQDFGDLTATSFQGSGMSNTIRGVFSLGEAGGSISNTMDYITIATTGNAKDFGDLTSGNIREGSACSDSHGGIG